MWPNWKPIAGPTSSGSMIDALSSDSKPGSGT
jgi:hypothetical protein